LPVPGAGFCFSTPVAPASVVTGVGDAPALEVFADVFDVLDVLDVLLPNLQPVTSSTNMQTYMIRRFSDVIPETLPSRRFAVPAEGAGGVDHT
jgi:hypothetical protein